MAVAGAVATLAWPCERANSIGGITRAAALDEAPAMRVRPPGRNVRPGRRFVLTRRQRPPTIGILPCPDRTGTGGGAPARAVVVRGDCAPVLHAIRSVESTGKAACLLPRSVLFGGNAEMVIHKKLVLSGQGEVSVPTETTPHGEFERQPVPRQALLGLKSFVGMYAGEHCAGTELMIGPLFVAAGVGALDLVVGLIVGNLMAVLSWTLLTAPIATRARLTLYWQLERICGRRLVTLYNLANGVMFCFLAGAMITVSATAVGVVVPFRMPELNDIYPSGAGWVLTVLGIGAVFTLVAACGYRTVSRVANIAAPWLVLVFLAFGVVALGWFVSATGVPIQSPADLWRLADTVIWRGGQPLPGQVKFTFWHVMFFAWFCNMAMHVGMADLSVLRFARKSWYAVASSSGMYLGHFLAWISASMLFAYQLRAAGLTSDEAIRQAAEAGVLPAPLPGPLAYQACGIAGLLCVIVAGWTTANPTIYRAGLAFQAIVPKRSRFAVTLFTGGIATVAALFPALAMKLLGVVALYGLVLMPMGAVVFIDFWVIKRLRLRSNYAEATGISFNWAAALAWMLTLAVCLTLVLLGPSIRWLESRDILVLGESAKRFLEFFSIQIYFVSLPGWFVAAGLYIVLSRLYQRKLPEASTMESTAG